MEIYFMDTTFGPKDILKKGEYENCIFNNFDFAHYDLSEFEFLHCTFSGCKLSLTKLSKTLFRGIKINDFKMLGLRFETCTELGLHFRLPLVCLIILLSTK